MSTTSLVLASLASSATVAGLTALYFRSRLNAATERLATYQAWWERDSGRAIIAEAKLDLIHQQHVDAGRKAHEPFRVLRRETTEKLMQCVAARDVERGPLDTGGIAAPVNRTARQDQPPAEPLSSCRGSAARSQDRIGGASTRSGRQDAGPTLYRRGQSLSADTPEMKGTHYG